MSNKKPRWVRFDIGEIAEDAEMLKYLLKLRKETGQSYWPHHCGSEIKFKITK